MNSIPARLSIYLGMLAFFITAGFGYYAGVPTLIILLRSAVAFVVFGLISSFLVKAVLKSIMRQAIKDMYKPPNLDKDVELDE